MSPCDPEAHYLGFLHGEELAACLVAADILIFPSRTDTFGLVNLGAVASGVSVAAYPVMGPLDIVQDGVNGALDEGLARAAARALKIDPRTCRARAAVGLGHLHPAV
jgi:glycosyltransferase involved in cell wall biosynthesis